MVKYLSNFREKCGILYCYYISENPLILSILVKNFYKINSNLCKNSMFLLAAAHICSCLVYILAKTFAKRNIFVETNILPKSLVVQIFHKFGPFVSNVADKLFFKLKEESIFVNIRIYFRKKFLKMRKRCYSSTVTILFLDVGKQLNLFLKYVK